MENRRGQGLSTNAIILIILGVVVLVVLIAGFAIGWDTLKEKIAPSNNVDSISKSCQTSCLTNRVFDFCSQERILKTAGAPELKGTCAMFSDPENSETYGQFGIDACPAIDCPSEEAS